MRLVIFALLWTTVASVDPGCTDKIVEEKQISGGKIMNIAQCGKRYDLETKEEAEVACKRNGAVLATYAQLEEAFKAGYSVCRCGWLEDGSVKWPTVGYAKGGCGKSDYINNCPASAMGIWGGGPGWNTFCFKTCDDEVRATIKVGDVVVSNIAKCGLRYQLKTKEEAQARCERNDATLATQAQLTAAYNAGLSVCRCGWLEDGSVKWPIVGTAGSGCGRGNTINNCPAYAMGSWGGPGWNAFCAYCADKITAEKDIEGGTVMNIARCGKRYQMKTVEQARSVCNRNGAVLATYDQLETAFNAGYSICLCGWLADCSVKWPINGPASSGCGKSNAINDCPSRYMGSWGGPGWNAHCFKKD